MATKKTVKKVAAVKKTQSKSNPAVKAVSGGKNDLEVLLEGAPAEVKDLVKKLSALKSLADVCCDETPEKENIAKTVKVKPEWKQKFDYIKQLHKDENAIEQKRKTWAKKVWSEIEIELGIFDKSMHYDEKRGLILIEK